MPHPCSHFWYQIWRQIIFKREQARLSSSLLNIICGQIWYQSKSDYLDRASGRCFGAERQSNHQNFKKSLLSYKCWLISIGMKQKNKFKKLRFSTPQILNIFQWKFYGLVLGFVGLIDAKGIDVVQSIWLRGCPT